MTGSQPDGRWLQPCRGLYLFRKLSQHALPALSKQSDSIQASESCCMKRAVAQDVHPCTNQQHTDSWRPSCAPLHLPAGRRPAHATTGRRLKPRTSRASSCSGNVISKAGHTIRGRVRQKSHKNAELLNAGSLR